MNTTITPNGLPALPQAKTSQGSAGNQASSASASGTASPQAGDSLKLTDSARALHQATSVNTQSPVDTAKVEQIRHALANGSYKVDAGKIAERLSSIESQINGTS